VRVLYRRVAKGVEPPLVTTAYKYFNAAGREVRFSTFPAIPGTPAAKKPKERQEKGGSDTSPKLPAESTATRP
jgi:hypothetical protein